MVKPRFVIYKDRAGFYRWYLQALNDEKVVASKNHSSKQTAINSALRVNWDYSKIVLIICRISCLWFLDKMPNIFNISRNTLILLSEISK